MASGDAAAEYCDNFTNFSGRRRAAGLRQYINVVWYAAFAKLDSMMCAPGHAKNMPCSRARYSSWPYRRNSFVACKWVSNRGVASLLKSIMIRARSSILHFLGRRSLCAGQFRMRSRAEICTRGVTTLSCRCRPSKPTRRRRAETPASRGAA